MINRRNFLVDLVAVGAAGAAFPTLAAGRTGADTASGLPGSTAARPHAVHGVDRGAGGATGLASTGAEDRAYWSDVASRLAEPVLINLADGRLKESMPVQAAPSAANREAVTHLEALGRLLAGLAPWLELGADGTDEGRLRTRYAELARAGVRMATNSESPDFMNFTRHAQPLVDAGFLAQAVLRAPTELWEKLDGADKASLIAALESTRVIQPFFNNWLLFSAMVEAALRFMGAEWDRMRVDYALRQHEQWYKGGGVYGNGAKFHWDYYNSFVIQPMLLDVLRAVGDADPNWAEMNECVVERARRYAAVQERMISPEGTFPPIGRSLAYRFGAFQLLGQVALMRALPEPVTPAQVRGALTAVIRRMIEAPGTFDQNGWLRIGFCGDQPSIGEAYVSTGSLYLCAVGLLPLGLPPTDAFWTAPAESWTSRRAWNGEDVPPDHAPRSERDARPDASPCRDG